MAGCSEAITAGQYGLMHVYGADETADPPIPGFQAGETMCFRVNGVLVDIENAPVWQGDRASHQVDMAVEIEVDVDEEFYNYLPVAEND